MKYLFDTHCYDLACVFLDDVDGSTETDRNRLATTIQSCIEDWLEDRESERKEEAEAAYGEYVDSKIDKWRETGERPHIMPFKGVRA